MILKSKDITRQAGVSGRKYLDSYDAEAQVRRVGQKPVSPCRLAIDIDNGYGDREKQQQYKKPRCLLDIALKRRAVFAHRCFCRFCQVHGVCRFRCKPGVIIIVSRLPGRKKRIGEVKKKVHYHKRYYLHANVEMVFHSMHCFKNQEKLLKRQGQIDFKP